MAGAGWIVRDWCGKWKAGFSYNIGTCDSLAAELWAALYGLEIAWKSGFRQVILETDLAAMAEDLWSEVAKPSRYSNLL